MPDISAFLSLSTSTPFPPVVKYLGVHLKGWIFLTTLDFQAGRNALPMFCVIQQGMLT